MSDATDRVSEVCVLDVEAEPVHAATVGDQSSARLAFEFYVPVPSIEDAIASMPRVLAGQFRWTVLRGARVFDLDNDDQAYPSDRTRTLVARVAASRMPHVEALVQVDPGLPTTRAAGRGALATAAERRSRAVSYAWLILADCVALPHSSQTYRVGQGVSIQCLVPRERLEDAVLEARGFLADNHFTATRCIIATQCSAGDDDEDELPNYIREPLLKAAETHTPQFGVFVSNSE